MEYFSQKHLFRLFLVLVVFVGFFLRFYKLGLIPDSLNWDEVSWGYNAYSILKTGYDEHGNFLSLSFKAFGDYKQPLYVYLTSVSIFIFGLNSFAVRFPSAFFGSLGIIAVYFFSLEFFSGFDRKNRLRLSLLTTAFYSLSPWSVQFSRVAYEANIGVFLVITATWLFLRAVRTRNWNFSFISIVIFSLSGYAYHSNKIFTSIFVGILFLIFSKYFLQNKKKTIILAVLFILLNLPWVIDMRTTARGRSVTIFANSTQILEKSVKQLDFDQKENNVLGLLLHNRRVVFFEKYSENYLAHFSPKFLFISGDNNPRHHTPEIGMLYLFSIFLVPLGIIFLLKNQNPQKSLLVFAYLFLAPAASALAFDSPNASRSLVFLPTWQVFEASGLFVISQIIYKQKSILKYSVLGLLTILISFNVFYYLHQYFVHTNYETQYDWQYGYEQAVNFTKDFQNQNVFFLEDMQQAYIFYLFYTKYDPASYIKSGDSANIVKECFNIDNYHFGLCEDKIKSGDMVVTTDSKDKDFKLLKTIFFENQEPAVYIYEKN